MFLTLIYHSNVEIKMPTLGKGDLLKHNIHFAIYSQISIGQSAYLIGSVILHQMFLQTLNCFNDHVPCLAEALLRPQAFYMAQ